MVVYSGLAALSMAILNSVMAAIPLFVDAGHHAQGLVGLGTRSFWMPVHWSSVSLGLGFAAALMVVMASFGQFGGALQFFVFIQVEFLGASARAGRKPAAWPGSSWDRLRSRDFRIRWRWRQSPFC